MKHAPTCLSCLLLAALLPVATAAAEAKPKSENVTSLEKNCSFPTAAVFDRSGGRATYS
jgi:hypothetical protein